MSFSDHSKSLFYLGTVLNVFSAYKHTQISFHDNFPRLDAAMGPDNPIVFSAKNNYLLGTVGYISIAIMQWKWAREGLESPFEKAFLVWYTISHFGFGFRYFLRGWYMPLFPLWLAPAVTCLGLL